MNNPNMEAPIITHRHTLAGAIKDVQNNEIASLRTAYYRVIVALERLLHRKLCADKSVGRPAVRLAFGIVIDIIDLARVWGLAEAEMPHLKKLEFAEVASFFSYMTRLSCGCG